MTDSATQYRDFGYGSEKPLCTHGYLLPAVLAMIGPITPGTRLLDVGCGNGSMAGEMKARGCDVVGIDLSEEGIAIARQSRPGIRFEVLAADQNLMDRLGEKPFDLVISTEVIEHLYDPRSYLAGCISALRPGGKLVCSTPYHGYLKNLTIALAGKWDTHANPLWDGGHIKLWSRRTLSTVLADAGFKNLQFRGAGRYPWMWKSMVMSGQK